MTERWFTVPQAAAQLGLHPKTVQIKCQQGVIQSRQEGRGHHYISQSQIDSYVRQHTRPLRRA